MNKHYWKDRALTAEREARELRARVEALAELHGGPLFVTAGSVATALPSPRRLIQLLRESGWEQISSRGDLYLRFLPPGDELGPRRRSLVVPLETEAPDFPELMQDAVNALRAYLGERPPVNETSTKD